MWSQHKAAKEGKIKSLLPSGNFFRFPIEYTITTGSSETEIFSQLGSSHSLWHSGELTGMIWWLVLPCDWSAGISILARVISKLPRAWKLWPPGRHPTATAQELSLLTNGCYFSWDAEVVDLETFFFFLILCIVYIFLFVDNNLMCLETTLQAYVPLGNILILLQMAWSLSFFKASHEL